MTAKDNKLVKTAQTMTAGVTPSKLELGATIDLHGHSAKITHTDAVDTMVQYANLARRTFYTHDLNGYLELGTFPVDTVFQRDTGLRNERAVIEAVTGSCCYQVRITTGGELPHHETYSYADFIAWHMDNSGKPVIRLETDTDLLDGAFDDEDSNPFETELKARVEQLQAEPEALQFGQAVIDDLRAKLDAANKAAEQAEINGQTRINELISENFKLKQSIQQQTNAHATVIAGYEEDIKRLETKAAILNPAPAPKEVCTLMQALHIPEMRKSGDVELAAKLSDGWTVLHIDISTEFTIDSDCHIRIVTLVRDLPATPAPKVAVTDAAIYSTPVTPGFRPPVQRPPMPTNQTILNAPVSRALTNNGPKPGETKRIPSLADIQARREKDNAEIGAIMQRGLDEQEALRRKFAQTPSPFPTIGAQ